MPLALAIVEPSEQGPVLTLAAVLPGTHWATSTSAHTSGRLLEHLVMHGEKEKSLGDPRVGWSRGRGGETLKESLHLLEDIVQAGAS